MSLKYTIPITGDCIESIWYTGESVIWRTPCGSCSCGCGLSPGHSLQELMDTPGKEKYRDLYIRERNNETPK